MFLYFILAFLLVLTILIGVLDSNERRIKAWAIRQGFVFVSCREIHRELSRSRDRHYEVIVFDKEKNTTRKLNYSTLVDG